MTDDNKKANEHFFSQVITTLAEGGVYGWVSEKLTFTKENNTLTGNEQAVKRARAIVTEEFGVKFFSVKK